MTEIKHTISPIAGASSEQKFKLGLLRFDFKTRLFLGFMTIVLFLSVLFKLHGSSIPIWNQLLNDGTSVNRGLICGQPQGIRSDEWAIYTPWILSQVRNNFPVSNETVGPSNTALLINLPSRNWFTIFRPNFWGFFFLDEDRAYSFYWDFRIYGMLVSTFLFLLLITGNNFWVSLFGTSWLFLSSGIQWWIFSNGICEIIMTLSLTSILFVYLLYEKKFYKMLLMALAMAFLAVFNIQVLYPPFQIPFIYLYLFVLTAYIITIYLNGQKIEDIPKKLMAVGIFLLITVLVLVCFFEETKDAINIVTNTIYPGKRHELGGTGFSSNAFSEYYSIFFTGGKYPVMWGNICELSHFITFFPIIFPAIIITLIKGYKLGPIIMALVVFQIVCYLWMWIQFPAIIAKISLLTVVPPFRLVIPMGVGGIFLTCVFLSSNFSFPSKKLHNIVPVYSFIFLMLAGLYIKAHTGSYFNIWQLVIIAILFSLLFFLLFFNQEKKYYRILFSVLVLLYLGRNILINPISEGLSPIRENALSKVVTGINKTDPGAKWVVMGDFMTSDLLKAAGINVFNGVSFAPKLEEMRVLDPLSKKDSVYNRYGYAWFLPYIGGKDSIIFNLIQRDVYSVNIDPCSPKLVELRIKYFLFTYKPQPAEVRYMTLLYTSSSGIFIYKRKL